MKILSCGRVSTHFQHWDKRDNGMSRTILITGSTDGIGLETAKILAAQGHHVLLHGCNAKMLRQDFSCDVCNILYIVMR